MKLGVYTAILHDRPLRDALEKIDPNMAVNIEHGDVAYGPLEGLRIAADTLTAANSKKVS